MFDIESIYIQYRFNIYSIYIQYISDIYQIYIFRYVENVIGVGRTSNRFKYDS